MSQLEEQAARAKEARARLMGKAPQRLTPRQVLAALRPISPQSEFAHPLIPIVVTPTVTVQASFEWDRYDQMMAQERLPPWKRITLEVCRKREVTLNDILSPRRAVHLVHARHEIWWRLINEHRFSYMQVAKRFNRDHTTVLHGVRMHEKRMGQDRSPFINTHPKPFETTLAAQIRVGSMLNEPYTASV